MNAIINAILDRLGLSAPTTIKNHDRQILVMHKDQVAHVLPSWCRKPS